MREAIEKEIGKDALEKIEKQIEKETKKFAEKLATQSAWIKHYVLFDFGFTGDYFYPHNIAFYDSKWKFLCYKFTDNASFVSLVPILNCEKIRVTWDKNTKVAVHILGSQTMP
jgi:hypothetical protein